MAYCLSFELFMNTVKDELSLHSPAALFRGKDHDTSVRIAGPVADVDLVAGRLKAFLQERKQTLELLK